MAEHLLIPKRLARALPGLKRAAWWLEAAFIRGVIGLLRALSPERATALAMGVTRVLGPLLPMWDKVARNLAIAFPALPAGERARLRRRIFAHLGAAIAELVQSERIWAERERRLEFRADPSIRGLQEGGRPMVLVTAHVGAWQLSNLVGAHFGLPITSLYASESNPLIAAQVLQLRERLKVRWIPSTGGIRSLITELRAGHSVGLACDTRLDQGEAVPYFGHAAMTNTVPARLALKQDCELVPVRVERLGGARYRVTMGAPIRPRDTGAAQAAPAEPMPPAEPAAPPLPALAQSDVEVRTTLADIVPAAAHPSLAPDNLLARAAALANGFARGRLVRDKLPLPAVPGKLIVVERGERIFLDTANHARYDAVVAAFAELDTAALARWYLRYEPLLQQAYEELGNGEERVREAILDGIELMLAAPAPAGELELKQPAVFYKYADPALEALPESQKLLIRMGPRNRAIIVAQLQRLRQALGS